MAYVNEKKIIKDKILKWVTVKTNNQTFKKYKLTHSDDLINGYSSLTQVEEFNSNNEAANPLIFEYDTTNYNIHASETNIDIGGHYLNFETIAFSRDFDGDGRLDFVANDNKLYKNLFNETLAHQGVSLPTYIDLTHAATTIKNNQLNNHQSIIGLKMHEVDGSNAQIQIFDLVAGVPTLSYKKLLNFDLSDIPVTVVVDASYYKPTCIYDYDTSSLPKRDPAIKLTGDYNGDGISELIISLDASDPIQLQTSGTPECWPAGTKGETLDYSCCFLAPLHPIKKDHYLLDLNPEASDQLGTAGFLKLTDPEYVLDPLNEIHQGDFNGDGNLDVLSINSAGYYTVVEIVKNGNNGYLNTISKGLFNNYWVTKKVVLGDYNGDGKTDILVPQVEMQRLWYLYTSNPKSSSTNTTNIFEGRALSLEVYYPSYYHTNRTDHFHQYYSLDINNDGKSDLVKTFSQRYKKKGFENEYETQWNITGYVNRIGVKGIQAGEEFIVGYSSPTSDNHLSNLPEAPKLIVAPFEYQGLSSDILVVRNISSIVTRVQFQKDCVQDATLKKVISGGGIIEDEIFYKPLAPENTEIERGEFNDPVYSSIGTTVEYPNVEIARMPTNKVVSRIKNTAYDIEKYQDYRYCGLVVNADGQGMLGFSKTARSEWHQDGQGKVKWNVTENDPLKRGATVRSYVHLEGLNTFTFYPLSKSLNTIPGIISSVSSNYRESTDGKVYSLLLQSQVSEDYDTNLKTETIKEYDLTYNLVTKVINRNYHKGGLQGETTTLTTYTNNASGVDENYFVGRVKTSVTEKKAYGDTQKASIEYMYGNNNLIETRTKANNPDGQFLAKSYMYDLFGNVVKETSKVVGGSTTVSPRTTLYTYDRTGRFIKTITNNLGQTSTNETFHPIYGLVTSSKGHNPNLTQRTIYDHWGKPIEEIDYLGRKKVYKYQRTNGLITIAIENEDGSVASKTTDLLGQLLESSQKSIHGQFSSIAYKYDFQGKRTETSEPYYSWNSPEDWNKVLYNDKGQIVRQEFANGKIVEYEYSELTTKTTTTTTEGVRTSSTTINANGHTTKTSDPGGEIEYTYNANGQLRTSSYEKSKQTIEYDDWGRKVKLTDPSAGDYTYQYDAYGNTINETTPLGSTEYTYDQYGRVVTKINKNKSGAALITSTNTYDPENHQLARIDVVSDGEATTYTYSYDSYDRLTFKSEETPYAKFNQAYTYDGFGRVYKELNTAVNKVDNSYQSTAVHNLYKNGFHWKIIDDVTSELIWSNDKRNHRGQLEEVSYGNGLKTFYDYQEFGLPKKIIHATSESALQNPGRQHVSTLSYVFNPTTTNLLSRGISGAQTISEEFRYDELDRLTKIIIGEEVVEFKYDKLGRFQRTDELGDYVYPEGDKRYQLTAIKLNSSGQQYQSSRTNQNIIYNSFKRPVRIEQENKEILFFSYNTFEQRSAMYYGDTGNDKSTKKLRKHYAHDGSKEFIYDSTTGETSFVTFIGGDAYSAPVIVKGDGSTKKYLYLHRDYQGTIVAITDSDGEIQESRLFDAWGGITSVKDGQGNELGQLTVLDRGYTGHEHLQSVGLINMNGRLYDAKVHRFLSPDNFVQDPTNTQNYNRYGYVYNNPLKYTDPSGEYGIGLAIAIGVSVAVNMYTIEATHGDGEFTGDGLSRTVVFAAFSSAVTFGIGSGVESIGNFFVRAGVQAVAHGTFQGVMAEVQGGKFINGFASGAIASIVSSAWQGGQNTKIEGGERVAAGGGFKGINNYIGGGNAGMIAFATISGGLGSHLTGGNFWKGALSGFMVSALNHQLHNNLNQRRVKNKHQLFLRLRKHYESGSGEDFVLTKAEFDYLVKNGEKYGLISTNSTKVSGNQYSVSINFYKSNNLGLKLAFGRATMGYKMVDGKRVYNSFNDTYDFDPKEWGVRSYPNEIITRTYGGLVSGKGFKIIYNE